MRRGAACVCQGVYLQALRFLEGMDAFYLKPTDQGLRSAMDEYTAWLDEQLVNDSANVDQDGKRLTQSRVNLLKSLVPPAGIEPAAQGLGILCSIP